MSDDKVMELRKDRLYSIRSVVVDAFKGRDGDELNLYEQMEDALFELFGK